MNAVEPGEPKSVTRAYELLLLLFEQRTDEAELFESLLDEGDHREFARAALALAAAVLIQNWGEDAASRLRLLKEMSA